MNFIIGSELYDHLEKVVDRIEDVSNEINSIVIDQPFTWVARRDNYIVGPPNPLNRLDRPVVPICALDNRPSTHSVEDGRRQSSARHERPLREVD
jgi:hypothetical protein